LVAPAANILAIIYAGSILGAKMVTSHIISALFMIFLVGMVMSFVFRKEEIKRAKELSQGKDYRVVDRLR
jgi:uncharacterized membrane protein YraQ (UPF0718 family)